MSVSIAQDVGIQHVKENFIEIKKKAEFVECCCESGSLPRKYFYVLENGIEWNVPMAFCCIPPNCCCPGTDHIGKMYFDRGFWDQQSFAWKIGCLRGAPSMFANNPKHVCCCVECCECYNNCAACHFPSICGDKVNVIPSEYFCCCCPTRATVCTNCCRLCGPENGEPTIFGVIIRCLQPGTGDQLAASINESRAAWVARTGKQ